jgi:two-component system NtrC family sensor kinase
LDKFFLYLNSNYIIEHSPDLDDNIIKNLSSIKSLIMKNHKEIQIGSNLYTVEYNKFKDFLTCFFTKKDVNLDKIINLGEMSAGMAHEINNSLSMIMSSFELIKFDITDELDDYDFKYIDHVETGISQMSDLVDGVLSYCREDQSMNRKFNLVKLIQKVENFSNSFLKKEDISLEINFDNSIDEYYLTGRDTLLYQVFMNLIKNSHDAIKELPKFSKWINIKISQDKNFFCLKFVDGGKGIPEKIQDKIFNNLFTTKGAGKGTGIGLSFSKKVIESHNGVISIDKNSKNTSFYIKLPKN